MINAKEANFQTGVVIKNKEKDGLIWNRLENDINKAIKKGEYSISFYETWDFQFTEKRKDVKSRLENLGYRVDYHRFLRDNGWYTQYFNCYEISWKDAD